MNDTGPITITMQRVEALEGRMDDINTAIGEIRGSMNAIRETFDGHLRQEVGDRREIKRDLRCVVDTWNGYKPLFDAWKTREEKRAERVEKVRAHVLGWSVVSVLSGIAYVIGEWLLHKIKGG